MSSHVPGDFALKTTKLTPQSLARLTEKELNSLLKRIDELCSSPDVQGKSYIYSILRQNRTIVQERLDELVRLPGLLEKEAGKAERIESPREVFQEALALAPLVSRKYPKIARKMEERARKGQAERIPDAENIKSLNTYIAWGYYALLHDVHASIRDPELSARAGVALEKIKPLIHGQHLEEVAKHKPELRELFVRARELYPALFTSKPTS